MHWEEVWTSSRPLPTLLRLALVPASVAYRLGWQAYLGLYRIGAKKAAHPHIPIICVGNLVVGGSGKSPATIYLAKLLQGLGHKVVISCSGYGSTHQEAATLAPEGALKACEWGDEPTMMRLLLPEIPLVVGRRRVLAAQLCQKHFPAHVLLMDDGFQHLPLAKDVSIVLDPGGHNRWTLPAGPYREPWVNRTRADLVIPGKYRVEAEPLTFLDEHWQPRETPPEANVLCALGSPGRFLRSVKEAGVKVIQERLLPDHDDLAAGNLFEGLSSSVPTIVTAKDWVKLQERKDISGRKILIAQHSVRIAPEEEFKEWLRAKLDETKT